MDAVGIEAALLFSILASPSYAVRESVGVPYHVATLGQGHPDLEVRQRCGRILEQRRVEAIRLLIEANRPMPWIDALGPEHSDRCQVITSFVEAARDMVYDDPSGQWPQWRYATELYLCTLSIGEARRTLAGMPRGKWWNGTAWAVVEPAPKPMER